LLLAKAPPPEFAMRERSCGDWHHRKEAVKREAAAAVARSSM